MNIVESPEFRAYIIEQIKEREFSERTGVHCSDLIYCIDKQVYRKLENINPTERELLRFSIGYASQRWLTQKLTDLPTIVLDGIQVTCDADSPPIFGLSAPWELKATWQSSEKLVEENPHWIHQIMAQCKVKGTTTAYLSRLEIMGNWKGVYGKKEDKGKPENQFPSFHCWRIDFTQGEIDKNWEWLKQRRDLYLGILETKKFLPKAIALPQGQGFECGECPKRVCEEA